MKRQSHKNRETDVDNDNNYKDDNNDDVDDNDDNNDDNDDDNDDDNNEDNNNNYKEVNNDDVDSDNDGNNRRRLMPKSTSGENGATEIRSTETETEKSRDIKNCGTSQEIFLSVFLQRSFQDV